MPEMVRTDELSVGDVVWWPREMALATITEKPAELKDKLRFEDSRNPKAPIEYGVRVVGRHNGSGEVLHVDCAPSMLWQRESEAPSALGRCRVRAPEETPEYAAALDAIRARFNQVSPSGSMWRLAELDVRAALRVLVVEGRLVGAQQAAELARLEALVPEQAAELARLQEALAHAAGAHVADAAEVRKLKKQVAALELREGLACAAEADAKAEVEKLAELESAQLFLAEYDGMEPELHRTLDGAKEFVADGASADMKSIPGVERAWDFVEEEDGVLQQVWTDPDTDAPLSQGPGRITPLRPVAPGPVAADGVAPTQALREDAEETNFFRPDRTYSNGNAYRAPELITLFRVEHVTRHPEHGHLRAIGWMRNGAPGSKWHGGFQDEGEFEGWTDVTEGGVS